MPPITQHLHSGADVDMFNLQPDDIHLGDIAHSLAMQCRFGGHTLFHYSVAQHCVYIAEQAWIQTHDATIALMGLLHDASEAYLIDLPRPIKMQPVCEFYLAAERKAQRTIMLRFDLPPHDSPTVKLLDEEMLAMECEQLFSPSFHPAAVLTRIDHAPLWKVNIKPWTPEFARSSFISMFVRFQNMRLASHEE